jgi:hypothetical protein
VSIQTALTCRTILAEKRRKKNKSKKAFLFLLVEEANWAGHQMEIDGIGACSCYISWPALKKRELRQLQ